MRSKYLLVLGLATGLVLSADAQAKPKISTDAVPGVNIGAYQTYTWVNTLPPSGMNPVLFQRIMADFDGALAQLGYRKVPSGGDLAMALTVGARQKTDIQQWGYFGLQTSIYQYTQGQLSLDVFDARTKQALWHGQVSETVDPNNPKPAKIDAAIAKLMQQFPPRAVAAPAAPSPAPTQ